MMGLFVDQWRRVTGVNGVILVLKKKSNDGNYRCVLKSNVVRNRWRRTESRESSLFSSAAISTDVSTEWAIINTLKDAKYLYCWNLFKKCYMIGLQQSSQSSLYCHHHRETHCSWCKITMCVLAEMLTALISTDCSAAIDWLLVQNCRRTVRQYNDEEPVLVRYLQKSAGKQTQSGLKKKQ